MQTPSNPQNPHTQEQVKVFLRINASRKGTDFICSSSLTESKLVEVLLQIVDSSKFLKLQCSSFIQKAVFVIEGHRIDSKSSQTISLRPDSIIHMINEEDTLKETIPVTFRYQNPQESQDISHQMEVNVNSTIEIEAQKITPLHFSKFVHQLTFVFLGAELSPSTTFKEANIGQHSEIILIDKLRNQRDQVDPFENEQEMPLQGFCLQPRKIQVQKKDSMEKDALNMPYNPIIEASKVRILLEQNVRQTELFIQKQQNNAILNQNSRRGSAVHQNEPIQSEAPLLVSIEEIEEKMDSEKNIATKEEIEAQKPAQKMEQEPSNE